MPRQTEPVRVRQGGRDFGRRSQGATRRGEERSEEHKSQLLSPLFPSPTLFRSAWLTISINAEANGTCPSTTGRERFRKAKPRSYSAGRGSSGRRFSIG